MTALSNPNEKAIRAQIAESVSVIDELDFPGRGPISPMCANSPSYSRFSFILLYHSAATRQSINNDDFNINLGVLEQRTQSFDLGAPKPAQIRFGLLPN
jgi:hypothetical protein